MRLILVKNDVAGLSTQTALAGDNAHRQARVFASARETKKGRPTRDGER
jgi:hypothetical protein